MSENDDEPTVPIDCPECGTTTRVLLEDVADTVERHNEQLHDGEEVARVDPQITDRLADLVADDLGLLDGPE